jgi:hypothetical protein
MQKRVIGIKLEGKKVKPERENGLLLRRCVLLLASYGIQ